MVFHAGDSGDDSRPGLVAAGRHIEEQSFRIIDREVGRHSFTLDEWPVVRRIIHTTGDPDYARWVRFQPQAIAAGVAALRRGAAIFADTRMIREGLAPWRLQWFANEVVIPVTNPQSQNRAEELGTTRSVAAFRHQPQRLQGAVVAIGNAPTALLEVVRLVQQENIRPALIIGVPVGFVQAVESKDILWQLKEQPVITSLGRKGGSTVAVAIVHALLELAKTGK